MRTPRGPIALAIALALLGPAASPASSARPAPTTLLDDERDGVWVGSVAVKTTSGVQLRPLLFNLDLAAGSVRGVALVPDRMASAATAIEALALVDARTKGKKLLFSLPAGGESALHPYARSGDSFDYVLRLRRGVLKGKMRSKADGIKGASKVELVQLDAERPLQHFWSGALATDDAAARGRAGTAPVAIFLSGNDPATGAGLVGGLAGAATARETADGIAVTIDTDAGEIALELTRQGAGFGGTATGAASGEVTLAPGGVIAAGRVTSISPGEVAAGAATELTITGRDLPAGAMAHFDHAGARAEPMETAADGRTATLTLSLADDVAAGSTVVPSLLGPDGELIVTALDLTVTDGGSDPVSFATDLLPILGQSCAVAGCHVDPRPGDTGYEDGATAAGNLSLQRAQAYGNLVNVPSAQRPALMRVAPNDPDDSYLIRKLRGQGIDGARMPFGGPYLSTETIARFVAWIEAGAPAGR